MLDLQKMFISFPFFLFLFCSSPPPCCLSLSLLNNTSINHQSYHLCILGNCPLFSVPTFMVSPAVAPNLHLLPLFPSSLICPALCYQLYEYLTPLHKIICSQLLPIEKLLDNTLKALMLPTYFSSLFSSWFSKLLLGFVWVLAIPCLCHVL